MSNTLLTIIGIYIVTILVVWLAMRDSFGMKQKRWMFWLPLSPVLLIIFLFAKR